MAKREYSAEERAAVLAALLAGESVSSVARKYRIPKGTVSAWQQRQVEPIRDGVATVATQKKDEFAELIVRLLDADLRGLIAVSELMADREWLRTQDAAALATLKGVSYDKVFKLLEALESPDAQS